MLLRARPRAAVRNRALILLMTALLLVHCSGGDAWGQGARAKRAPEAPAQAKPMMAREPLPTGVVEMLDGIRAAIKSGRIEDLRPAIAWNELPPVFAAARIDDPILFLKQQSADGEGREMLAILAAIIDAGHAVLPVGRDLENNRLYVWPRFAEMELDKLSREDEVQLYRLLKPAEVKVMREKRKWTWYRLAIGADGTWHSFQKGE